MPVPAVAVILLLEDGHDTVLVVGYRLNPFEFLGCRFEQAVTNLKIYDRDTVVLCELFDLFVDAGGSSLDRFTGYLAASVKEVPGEAFFVLEFGGDAVGYDPVEAFVAEPDMVKDGLVRENTVMEKDKDK